LLKKDYSQHVFRLIGRKKEKGVIAVLPFPLQASFNFPSGKGKDLENSFRIGQKTACLEKD